MPDPVPAPFTARSRRELALATSRDVVTACPRPQPPSDKPMPKDVYRSLLHKSNREPWEEVMWEANLAAAHAWGQWEQEALASLRGAMSALVALREAVRADASDAAALEGGQAIRDHLQRVWGVSRVPDGYGERDALARSVVGGMR